MRRRRRRVGALLGGELPRAQLAQHVGAELEPVAHVVLVEGALHLKRLLLDDAHRLIHKDFGVDFRSGLRHFESR